jgi:hypothetical protein
LNLLNLHQDGTYEADFGAGASNLDGGHFFNGGQYKIRAASGGSLLELDFGPGFAGPSNFVFKVEHGGIALWRDDASASPGPATFTIKPKPMPVTLTFNEDWTSTQSGPLVVHQTVLVEYAAKRDQCPIVDNPASAPVTLFGRSDVADSGELFSAFTMQPLNGTFRTLFIVPEGTDLALWFAQSSGLCSTFDSAFGKNYHFAITP